jgi:hypothetical protein
MSLARIELLGGLGDLGDKGSTVLEGMLETEGK